MTIVAIEFLYGLGVDMETEHLVTFDRIVREGNFSRAAWALNLTQPDVVKSSWSEIYTEADSWWLSVEYWLPPTGSDHTHWSKGRLFNSVCNFTHNFAALFQRIC